MSFWLDRFRKEDEEDIWEELKQMLLNSPSEQEIALKKQEEQAKIDAVVERMFPDIKKTQSEPYLRYEDLLNPQGLQKRMQEQYMQEDYQRLKQKGQGDLIPQDILQKMDMFSPKKMNGINSLAENYEQEELVNELTPLQKGYISTERQLTPYEEIDSRQDWSEEMKAQKKAEVAKIQEAARAREKEIDREHAIKQAKNYGGAALEVGSAFVPGLGGVKLAGAIAKKLAPKFGRKIAQEVSTGMLKGTSSGAIEGLGRGLLEDENILKTAGQDAVTGAVLGTGLGTAGANVQKVVKGNELKKYDNLLKNKKISKPEKKEFIKAGNKYYQDYEQGAVTDVEGLGNVKLPSGGLKETITQKPEHIVDVINLSKNLKKSKVLDVEKPKHSHKYDINKFYHLGGGKVDYQIAENQKGDKYFYKITDPYLTGPKPEGKGLLGAPMSTSNIVSSSPQNLNPNSQTIRNKLSYNAWLEELKRKRRGMF